MLQNGVMGSYLGMKYQKIQQDYDHTKVCLCVVFWKVSSSVQGFSPACAVGLWTYSLAFEGLLYGKGVTRGIQTFDIETHVVLYKICKHLLNKKKCFKNLSTLSKFMISCWAKFLASLRYMWPVAPD